MKAFPALLFAVASAISIAQAQSLSLVTPPVRAARVGFHTFESKAAKSKGSYHLYTPEVYDTEHDSHLDVGFSNNGGRSGNLNSAEMAIIPIENLRIRP